MEDEEEKIFSHFYTIMYESEYMPHSSSCSVATKPKLISTLRPVVDYCICSRVVLIYCDVSSFTHVCILTLYVVQTAASRYPACLLFVPFH